VVGDERKPRWASDRSEPSGDERPLRVVVADDHPFYRRGLARALEEAGIEVIGDAPNGEAAVGAVQETAPDVIVMDLEMPGLSGLEATRRVAERAPSTRVLVASVSAQEGDVSEAILAGAGGYVLKDEPVEEIAGAIAAVASGKPFLSARVAAALLGHIRAIAGTAERLAGVHVSPQELEVLDLLSERRSDGEIAELLGVDRHTVQSRISTVLVKLRVENRVQAALRAFQEREL
jgi:DNA-binding NarL/FixJ family response regulator